MSKKMLAALFAAAFLVSGGVAVGADDVLTWNGTTWATTTDSGNATGGANPLVTITATTSVTDGGTWTGGAATTGQLTAQNLNILGAGSGTTSTVAQVGVIATNAKTIQLGLTATNKLQLTAETLTIADSVTDAFTINNGSKLITTGTGGDATTIGGGTGGTLTVAQNGTYENQGDATIGSAATLTAAGNIINSGKIDNTAGGTFTFAATSSYTGAADGSDQIANKGATISVAGAMKDISAIIAAAENGDYAANAGYDIGTIELTGTTLAADIVATRADGGTVDATSLTGTVAKDIKVNEAELKLGSGTAVTFSGDIETGVLTLDNNGANVTFAGTVTGKGNAATFTTAGNGDTVFVKKGLDNFATLTITSTDTLQNDSDILDLSDTEVNNAGGTIKNNKELLLGEYNGGGAIDNRATGAVVKLDGAQQTSTGDITQWLDDLVSGGAGNIGTTEIYNEVDSLAIVEGTSITNGSLLVSGTMTNTADATAIDVGAATLELSGNNNEITGTIDAKQITFSGNTGEYSGVVTAAAGISVTGQDNLFNDLVQTTTGNIDIKGDSEFLGGLKTTAPNGVTTLFGGYTGTIGGDLETNFIAKDGSTLNVGENNLNIKSGSFKTEDGSTIAFLDENNDGKVGQISSDNGLGGLGGTIDLTGDTNLYVDRSLGDQANVVLLDKSAIAKLKVDGKDDKAYIQDYLDRQSFRNFSNTGMYTLTDDGEIDYNFKVASTDEEYAALFDGVISDQGMGRYSSMISDNTYQSMLGYGGITTIADFEKLNDKYIAELMQLAASDKVSGKEAYALHQYLNGAAWAGSLEAVIDTARNFNRAILNRAYNIGHLMNDVEYDECGNPVDYCGGYRGRLWAGYTGQWGDSDGRGWDQGYKYDAHGFNIGYDHITSSGIGFGAAFGYSKGDYENKAQIWGDDSKIHNYSFGLFASYNHASGWFSTLSGSYTYSRYKMNNGFSNGFTSENPLFGNAYGRGSDYAKYHGNTWSIGWKTGFDWKPMAARGLTITPTIGLYYYDSKTNRFDSDRFNGMKYSRRSFEMPIDVTAKYDIALGCDSTLSLIGTAGYAYNFHNKGTKIHDFTDNNGALYAGHRSPDAGRSAWNVGGGVQYRYRNFDVGVNYEYYGRSKYDSHSVFANVGVSF